LDRARDTGFVRFFSPAFTSLLQIVSQTAQPLERDQSHRRHDLSLLWIKVGRATRDEFPAIGCFHQDVAVPEATRFPEQNLGCSLPWIQTRRRLAATGFADLSHQGRSPGHVVERLPEGVRGCAHRDMGAPATATGPTLHERLLDGAVVANIRLERTSRDARTGARSSSTMANFRTPRVAIGIRIGKS
jgi:hypothetical protein